MLVHGLAAEQALVNGSTGDPLLYVDYPDSDNALLFDAGETAALSMEQLADLRAVFVTHHHVDHFMGLDRIVRANIDADKVLSIFGPVGTIQKVYDRIRSYEYQFFPFQKIVLDLVEIEPARLIRARIECTKRFPPPQPVPEPRTGRTIFTASGLTVEAVAVDHTVPCLAYALVEAPAYHVTSAALTAGALRPGAWIQQVAARLESSADRTGTVTIQGLEISLAQLAEQYFQRMEGGRLAYVTDTLWSESVQTDLIELCRNANRLYCDSFYAQAQAAAAAKHKHMTTHTAAELATKAKVRELILMHFSSRYRGRYHALVEEARARFPRVSAQYE